MNRVGRRMRAVVTGLALVTLGACDVDFNIDEFFTEVAKVDAAEETRRAKEAAERAEKAIEAGKLLNDVFTAGEDVELGTGEKDDIGRLRSKTDKAVELDPANEELRAVRFLESKKDDPTSSTTGLRSYELLKAISDNRKAARAAATPPQPEPRTDAEHIAENRAVAHHSNLVVLDALAKLLLKGASGNVVRPASTDPGFARFAEYCHRRAALQDTFNDRLDLHTGLYGSPDCSGVPLPRR